jgi:hypothetical protein
MTREDIIKLAKKSKWGASGSKWLVTDAGVERFAALVAAHREAQSIHTCPPDCQKPLCVNRRREIAAAVEAEREACAALMERQHTWISSVAASAAIRARGSK